MEALVKPVESIKYEISRQIILSLLQQGLISKLEFTAIDKENIRSFTRDKKLN